MTEDEAQIEFRRLFPGVLNDGALDIDRLGELLGVPVTAATPGTSSAAPAERYGLSWAGRSDAVRALRQPSRAALLPDRAASVDFDQAPHTFIEGDNLEVLKLLVPAYRETVKLIYLDPPYNTGHEFVYADDWSEPLAHYLRVTGQLDEEGRRRSATADLAGRKHSRWLSMMYPRLMLARALLRDDGVLAVSIDQNEGAQLRLLLDEVFGAENFVGDLAVIRAEGGGLAEQVVQGHDSLLLYARNRAEFPPLRRPKDFRGEIVQHEGSEYWVEDDWLRKEFGKYGTCHYEEIAEVRGAEYLAEVDARLASGEYRLVPKKNGRHAVGRLRPTATDGAKFYSVLRHLSKDGKKRLEALGMAGAFDFPKPVSLVQSLVLGATFADPHAGDVVLDFFAGSGTTGDAVLAQNALDGGNRRFVLVQLPELLGTGPETLADVSLRRVLAARTDVGSTDGVRVLRLGAGQFREPHVPGPEALVDLTPSTLVDPDAPLDTDAIVAQILLKEGVRLDAGWQRIQCGETEAVLADGVLVAPTRGLTEQLTDRLLDLGPRVLVVLEDGFAGADEVKANLIAAARAADVTVKTY